MSVTVYSGLFLTLPRGGGTAAVVLVDDDVGVRCDSRIGNDCCSSSRTDSRVGDDCFSSRRCDRRISNDCYSSRR